MKQLGAILTVLVTTAFVNAGTVMYGWEDGGTILGSFGNLVDPMNVISGIDPYAGGATVTPYSGSAMLQVTEAPHYGTPQAYVAFITGLTDGDIVDASFYGWDSTIGASPAIRIWGHYALSSDVNSYSGSAGGNSTYTDGTGWTQVAWSWTFDSNSGSRDALVIEARLYSIPPTDETASTDYWIDNLSVTAPDHATIITPVPEVTTITLLSLGSLALIRRRK